MSDGLTFTKAELEARGYRVEGHTVVRLNDPPPDIRALFDSLRSGDGVMPEDALQRAPAKHAWLGPRSAGENPAPLSSLKYGTAPNGRRYRSKWEAAYAAELDLALRADAITWWAYEELTLYIGANVRYTPDFLVRLPNGGMVAREVKGWFRDDAKTKFRVAAKAHPWLRFEAITKRGGRWETSETHNA